MHSLIISRYGKSLVLCISNGGYGIICLIIIQFGFYNKLKSNFSIVSVIIILDGHRSGFGYHVWFLDFLADCIQSVGANIAAVAFAERVLGLFEESDEDSIWCHTVLVAWPARAEERVSSFFLCWLVGLLFRTDFWRPWGRRVHLREHGAGFGETPLPQLHRSGSPRSTSIPNSWFSTPNW